MSEKQQELHESPLIKLGLALVTVLFFLDLLVFKPIRVFFFDYIGLPWIAARAEVISKEQKLDSPASGELLVPSGFGYSVPAFYLMVSLPDRYYRQWEIKVDKLFYNKVYPGDYLPVRYKVGRFSREIKVKLLNS